MTTLTKSYSEIGKCTECGGTGWIDYQKPASEVTVEGNKIYEGQKGTITFARRCPSCSGGTAVIQRVKKRANIPASFYDAEFNDFDWDVYLDNDGKPIDMSLQKRFVTSFLMDFPKWSDRGIGLYIWSKTRGSGKTFLASTICNTLIKERRLTTKFVSVSNLIDLVNESRKDGTMNPIKELCECDVLVLDDIGQQNTANEWLMDILFKICDSRIQEQKITIATSNKKIYELKFDDRILDRLNRMCQMIPLPDYCVRSSEATQEKKDLFAELGLMGEPKQQKLKL